MAHFHLFLCLYTILFFSSAVFGSDAVEKGTVSKRGILDNLLHLGGGSKNGTGSAGEIAPAKAESNKQNETKSEGNLQQSSSSSLSSSSAKGGIIGSIEHKLSEAVKKLIGQAEKVVSEINTKAKNWEAKLLERFANLTQKEKEAIMGLKLSLLESVKKDEKATVEEETVLFKAVPPASIPKQFDARQKWPACAPVINAIADQSSCGSCWAVSTASVYNDRHCIEQVKAGKQPDTKLRVSAADLMACNTQNHGCNGGVPYYAWQYINKTGIVSGSEWVDKQGCEPYPFPPNKYKDNQNEQSTPQCASRCTNAKYSTTYSKDKKFATNALFWSGSGLEQKMQAELLQNGPINVGMTVHEDLMYYSSGVYHHVTGGPLGGHAVRIIGWGEEKGVKYWLVANSWNTDWGEKGFFRIRRGTNEETIESLHIAFGTPKI